ncbi:MAG: hypothetical protein Q9M16_03735 [Mariprofundus sp.]|nr:hypothetical protein [Mariprofundus sp.]
MNKPVYIDKNKPKPASQDYTFLRKKGIEHIEALAGSVWTDYNIHDPGITILEMIAYAITELGYRTNFKIEDILSELSLDGLDYKDDLFTAREILTCNAVTLEDFRKIMIDVEGVKNAWLNIVEAPEPVLYLNAQASQLEFESAFYISKGSLTQLERVIPAELMTALETLSGQRYESQANYFNALKSLLSDRYFNRYKHIIVRLTALYQPIRLRGIYDVIIELDDSWQQADVLNRVEQRLHECRNLCEDFNVPQAVNVEDVFICAELNVAIDADANRVLAEVYFQIEQFLAPRVTFYSLNEMLEKGLSAQSIFEGPRLEHGFIDDVELQRSALKSVIHISDILQIIMDVEGVLSVKQLMLNSDKQSDSGGQRWCLPIRGGHAVRLNVQKSRVSMYKEEFPVHAANLEKYLQEFRSLQRNRKLGQGSYDIAIPAGESKNIQQYHSIQNDFPLVYGLAAGEILKSDTPLRKAQSKQLKAYLLFYDRILADFLAQLAHSKHLFSINPALHKTYYSQPLSNNTGETFSDIPDVERLFIDAVDGWNRTADRDDRVENKATFNDRKNRFLNHLMARFGEQFTDYVGLLYNMKNAEELIPDKLSFLKACPEISYARARAFNYSLIEPVWQSDNISGLEKRVARLLGIDSAASTSMADCIDDDFEVETKASSQARIKYRFRLKKDDLSYFRVSAWFDSEQSACVRMKAIIRFGADESNYHLRKTASGRFTYDLQDDSGALLATAATSFKRADLRQQKISATVLFIQAMDDNTERFHLVEHVLLRPNKSDGELMNVSTEYGDQSCSGLIDPYSFRLTVVLPYWSERFLNMDFRALFEKTIRKEAPAHIHVKICWVDQIRMQQFESAFYAWLKAVAAHGSDDVLLTQTRNHLIRALAKLRSIYPESVLHGCKNEHDNAILLNRSILGTIQEK